MLLLFWRLLIKEIFFMHQTCIWKKLPSDLKQLGSLISMHQLSIILKLLQKQKTKI